MTAVPPPARRLPGPVLDGWWGSLRQVYVMPALRKPEGRSGKGQRGQGPIIAHYRTGADCGRYDGRGNWGHAGIAPAAPACPLPAPPSRRLPLAAGGNTRAANERPAPRQGARSGRRVVGSSVVGRLPDLVQAVGQARPARLAQREGQV